MTLPKTAAPGDSPIKVLLIDDDEDSYVLTRDLLAEIQSKSYEFRWAASAEAGVAAFEAESFHVALVDFYLGALNGDAVIAELRRRKTAVPLILLTSHDLLKNDIAVMDAGADEFLIKGDLNAVTLERTIRFSMDRGKQAAALRASEERFRDLFESNQDAILVTEPNGTILAANPAAEVLFRMKREEIISRGRRALIAVEDVSATALDARLQAGAFRDEILFRRGDGSTFTGEITVAGLSDHAGGRASMIIRDLSARRATERRTITAERRLRRFETVGPYVAAAALATLALLTALGMAVAAVIVAAVVILSQLWLRTYGTKRRTFAFSSLAEWREHAIDARRGLFRYAEYLQVDPESGLGTRLAMQHAVERQLACFRRTGETFSFVVVEIADPESPRRDLPPSVVQSASKLLAVAATVEESVSRINANTFGILLPGCDRDHSVEFIEQYRQRLCSKLLGDTAALRVVAGAAEVSDGITSFEQLLKQSTDDLEEYDRELARQMARFAADRPRVA